MKDYLVCYIQGKRCALTWDDLERRKIQQQQDHTFKVGRRVACFQWLYEALQGDTRDFHDMEEQWRELLDSEEDEEPRQQLLPL